MKVSAQIHGKHLPLLVLPFACLPFSFALQAQETDTTVASARTEELVVTASRGQQRLGNIAASVEVVTEADFQEISGTYLTDVLKKGASLDVLEYPGGQSGVGLRGFRPEFSGTNKHVLILLDGHPAGFTSVGTAMRASIGRVEVLKGSASALYGSSAMGGVVNFISHQSRGPVQGQIALGTGSFAALTADARIGGSLTERLNFDLSYAERSQQDDYRMGKERKVYSSFVQGGGARRPNTTFEHRSLYGRAQYQLTDGWSLQGRAHGYYSNDVYTPGAESDGVSNVGMKDLSGHTFDLNLRGELGAHSLYALAYTSREDDIGMDVDAGRYRDGTRLTRFDGFQVQDSWHINDSWLILFGLDHEQNSNTTKRYNPNGSMRAPFSPNDKREIWGSFAELTGSFLDERLIINAGVRYDRITAEVMQTPLRPDLTPGETTVDTTNPRIGVVFRPSMDGAWRLHASAGTGFVTPLASQLAGFTDEMVGSQRRIQRGNPNLSPEESDSYDFGIGYESGVVGADLTWFRMDNRNKIESVFLSNTSTLREVSYVNASSAVAEGFELSVQGDLGRLLGGTSGTWQFESTSTYYLQLEQSLPTGNTPLRNVAKTKFNASISYHRGPATVKLGGRHVSGTIDQDFSTLRLFSKGNSDIFEYPGFTVFDLFASWHFDDKNQLTLQVDNIEDEYYFEKNDYPFAGRSYSVTWRHSF